jgi:hypothetical protein
MAWLQHLQNTSTRLFLENCSRKTEEQVYDSARSKPLAQTTSTLRTRKENLRCVEMPFPV